MKYKIALIIGIILFLLDNFDAQNDEYESNCSNCKILRWRPLKRIFKRQELRKYHYQQQQAAKIQKIINNRKPKFVKDDIKSSLKNNLKMIHDAFLSNLREDNSKTNVRNRREKKVIEITRKHKFKKPWLKLRERWSNKILKRTPTKPPSPPTTPPPNDALLIVKNLRDLTKNSRNLAQKGLEALYKALDD